MTGPERADILGALYDLKIELAGRLAAIDEKIEQHHATSKGLEALRQRVDRLTISIVVIAIMSGGTLATRIPFLF